MNKAEKRLTEMRAVSNIYGMTVSQVKWLEERIDGLKKYLEADENADTKYHEKEIEELEVEIKAYEKIKEHLFKLM